MLPPSSGSWSSVCRATWPSGEWPGAGSSYSAVTTLFFLIITGCGAFFCSKGDCNIALWFLVCVAHRKGTEGHWGGCRSTDSEEMRMSLEPPHPGRCLAVGCHLGSALFRSQAGCGSCLSPEKASVVNAISSSLPELSPGIAATSLQT